jgi:hypothetical protein
LFDRAASITRFKIQFCHYYQYEPSIKYPSNSNEIIISNIVQEKKGRSSYNDIIFFHFKTLLMNSIQPLENASQFFFSPNLVNLSKLEKKGPFFCWLSFTVSSMRRAVCTMEIVIEQ